MKKQLTEELLNQGYRMDKYKNFEKNCNNLNITVRIYSNLFGKITMIGLIYKFKQELKLELHDEVWNKSVELIDKANLNFEVGALGYEYIEASIQDEELIKNINATIISNECKQFTNLITPLLDDYNL